MKNRKSSGVGLVLVADYIFYVLPFLILSIVRIVQDRSDELVLISDWSIASTIMYGQVIVKLSAALAKTQRKKHIPPITLYLTILVCLGLVVNVVVYVLMLLIPSLNLGIMQLILFLVASICHFLFGSVIGHIQKASSTNNKL